MIVGMRRIAIAMLPNRVCREALFAGKRTQVLPDCRGFQGIVRLGFTTHRGLPSAVRALIDHLAAGFPREVVARMP